MTLAVGNRVLVFDPKLWNGQDQGDNSQFYKPATILGVSGEGLGQVATVRFEHDGRTSGPHFTEYMKALR